MEGVRRGHEETNRCTGIAHQPRGDDENARSIGFKDGGEHEDVERATP